MKFHTEIERLAHPQARYFPFSVMDRVFSNSLDNIRLELMTSPWETVRARIVGLKTTSESINLCYWYCITFSHPTLSPDELAFLADALNISIKEQLLTSAYLGRMDVLNRFPWNYSASLVELLSAAAERGQLPIIDRLIELAGPEVISALKVEDYEVFRLAAENGHLPVVNKLMELAADQALNMIKKNDYEAFRLAAQNGHLHVINKLIELAPGEVQNMIKSLDYFAFQLAARNGHHPVINKLIELAPDEVNTMIKAHSYAAFHRAAKSGHLPVANRLLSFYPVMAHAELHESEYRHIMRPFITARIASLRSQRQALEAANPDAVFNLTDDNEIKQYFYILRNLIRRNDTTLLDDIRFILDIPAVKGLAHQEVSVGQSNELLRLALTVGNRAAAQILLTIPAVNALAATQNYYRTEVHAGIDVAALARDRESSMHALTVGENQRLSAAIDRYQPIMREGGEPLFDHLLDILKERYEAQPAMIKKDDGSELVLPLEWGAFVTLSLNDAERERALKAYYKHKDHTALRYLSVPNQWMSEQASYVYINDAHTERSSTFADYKPLIVMLWLAASDRTIAPTDGYTLEGRIDHFVDELAHIGRAHNWDGSRLRADGHGNEEFDDLTGDKPSCFSGVKRRLFQSVVGHPMLRILTTDDVRQEVSAFIYSKFKAHITATNRVELIAVWTKLINLDEVNPEPLKALNIASVERTEFSDYMSTKYGAQFNNEPAFTQLMTQFCPEDGIHAQVCDGLFDMLKLLRGSAVVSVAASPDSFFSAPAHAGAGITTSTAVGTVALVQCGCFSFF